MYENVKKRTKRVQNESLGINDAAVKLCIRKLRFVVDKIKILNGGHVLERVIIKGEIKSFPCLRLVPSTFKRTTISDCIRIRVPDQLQSHDHKLFDTLIILISFRPDDEMPKGRGRRIAKSLPGSPRIVLLVPTAELASQDNAAYYWAQQQKSSNHD
uniref:Uncharacterized protein n=1 Tax=Tanacetum cinerariifolium TaxID=118510 RepID=A0A6L2LNW1_TANCI|nr:hypothetical protein [Tanacetum cinerariifolium]